MDSAGRVTAGREGAETPVSWLRAAGRGFAGRCPTCGRGGLFKSFLKVREHCATCGQELYHHRADDLAPYIVIFVVGHVVGTGILLTEVEYDLPLWLPLTLWPALGLILSIARLQPAKGAVVDLQWAFGMHGFGGEAEPGTGGDAR
jgi:uncharacterized protein (DUF983 family)